MIMKPNEPAFPASETFDVLVKHAGASESMRGDFVHNHTSETPCDEYRFQGTLGFGGKYWRKTNSVSFYTEDTNADRIKTFTETNKALAMLAEAQRREGK